MAVTKVVVKNAEIDGKPITWNVLAITGYMDGDFQTLELKLSKTEAMLANLLLNSKESGGEVHTRKATEGEQIEVNRKKKEDKPESDGWFN